MKSEDRARRAFEAIQAMAPNGTHAQAMRVIEQEIREAVEDCQAVERKVKPEFFCDKCGYSGPIRQRHPRPHEPGGICNYEAGPLPEPKCSCDQDVHTPCPIHYAMECGIPYPGYKPQPIREDFEQQEARIAHNRAAESNHLKRHIQTANNLLAVMHRDGGHHTGAHGFKQSCLDAEKRYYEMVREIAVLKGPCTCDHDPKWAGGACAACHADALDRIEKLEKGLSDLYDATVDCKKHSCQGLRNSGVAAKAHSLLNPTCKVELHYGTAPKGHGVCGRPVPCEAHPKP